MSAREIIASWISGYADSEGRANSVLEELTDAGYRVLGPDEVDPVTVERCAQIADILSSPASIAKRIRALASGGKQ